MEALDALVEPRPVVVLAVLACEVGHSDEPHPPAEDRADRLDLLQLGHGVGKADPVQVGHATIDIGRGRAVDVAVNVYDRGCRVAKAAGLGGVVQSKPVGRMHCDFSVCGLWRRR